MATVNFIPCSKQCVSSMKNEIAYVVQDIKVCIECEKHDVNHTINYQTYSADMDTTSCIRLISGKDCCPDFEVVIATHIDNEHLHSHFIINLVSFKTGNKLHETPKTLLKLRASSDRICKQYGLSTIEPYVGGKSQNLGTREYRAAAKGESRKFELMNTIDYAMKVSRTNATGRPPAKAKKPPSAPRHAWGRWSRKGAFAAGLHPTATALKSKAV